MNDVSCRNCGFFVRCKEEYSKIAYTQGFCLLGMLEGHWSLYDSSSLCDNCMAYTFNTKNKELMKCEQELKDLWNNYTLNVHDERTKEAKKVKELVGETRYKESEREFKRLPIFHFSEDVKEAIVKYLMTQHKEKYDFLWNNIDTTKKYYFTILHDITQNIANKYGKEEVKDVLPDFKLAIIKQK